MKIKMMKNCSIVGMALFFLFGVAVSTEDYIDYTADENANRELEDLHEFYRILFRRSTIDNNDDVLANSGAADAFGLPDDHLMIRKAQRAPSLRLRFGRSQPWRVLRHAQPYLPKPLRFGRAVPTEAPVLMPFGRSEPAAMPERMRLGSRSSVIEEN